MCVSLEKIDISRELSAAGVFVSFGSAADAAPFCFRNIITPHNHVDVFVEFPSFVGIFCIAQCSQVRKDCVSHQMVE